jgi:hypothetical protein
MAEHRSSDSLPLRGSPAPFALLPWLTYADMKAQMCTLPPLNPETPEREVERSSGMGRGYRTMR